MDGRVGDLYSGDSVKQGVGLGSAGSRGPFCPRRGRCGSEGMSKASLLALALVGAPARAGAVACCWSSLRNTFMGC